MQGEQRRRRERKVVEVGVWVLGRDKVLLLRSYIDAMWKSYPCGVYKVLTLLHKTCFLQLNIINQ